MKRQDLADNVTYRTEELEREAQGLMESQLERERELLLKELEAEERMAPTQLKKILAEGKRRSVAEMITEKAAVEGTKLRASSHEDRSVHLPPGSGVARLAQIILTRGAYKIYVQPHIADMQHEYIEVLAKVGIENAHTRWIRARGYALILWSLVCAALTSVAADWIRSKK